MDRDVEFKAQHNIAYINSSIYYIVLFKRFRARIYLGALKDESRWQLTTTYHKAFRFDYAYYAYAAIEAYATMYHCPSSDFRVMKIQEEIWGNANDK